MVTIRSSAGSPLSQAAREPSWCSIMLVLSCGAQRLRPLEPDAPPAGAVLVPLSAFNIGQDDHQQTFMMLEVGATALMFGLPPAMLEEIGQTLLALSAQASAKPS
jgi:hypothetical protein